ncbi:MAG: DUF3999 domain-containing protein [Pseudoxanthomonas sp.]
MKAPPTLKALRAVGLGLLLVAGSGLAVPAEDYARQWSLSLPVKDAGAYRVELDEAVYWQVQSPEVLDLDVLNAQGQTVPAVLQGPPRDALARAALAQVPWFALPQRATSGPQDISLISQRNVDGSIRAITAQVGQGPDLESQGGWLVDTTHVQGVVQALQLDWAPLSQPLQQRYRVEGSEDLRNWALLADEAPLLDLRQGGERLRQSRIALSRSARYLRLVPMQAQATLPVTGVQVELAPAIVARDWKWQTLQGRAVTDEKGQVAFEYAARGRFPFQRVDLQMQDNSTQRWRLQSREDEDDRWHDATPSWVAFELTLDGAKERSSPQALSVVKRDRQWRLLPINGAPQTAPPLRLGYLPEEVVFLAQGAAPFSLVAGSARARRASAPLDDLLSQVRQSRGTQWEPPQARLGDTHTLAGSDALIPASTPMNWKAWLLWGVLIGGAALVAVFALSLLRRPALR